jgi:hypothetical protein
MLRSRRATRLTLLFTLSSLVIGPAVAQAKQPPPNPSATASA